MGWVVAASRRTRPTLWIVAGLAGSWLVVGSSTVDAPRVGVLAGLALVAGGFLTWLCDEAAADPIRPLWQEARRRRSPALLTAYRTLSPIAWRFGVVVAIWFAVHLVSRG